MTRERGSLPVTVVIPVKNEETNLGACLSRLSRFSDILIVDSASTDNTLQIAESRGVKVVQFAWNGRYPKKRNWVLLNHDFLTEWVLFLDADEFVDDRFCDEIERTVGSTAHSGFWLSYDNFFLGRRLRHGVPQRKLALFRVGSGLYEPIAEEAWSKLDMEVHEHPVIDGSLGAIGAPIEHNDRQGIEQFVERHCDYAKWEARRVLALRERSATQHDLTPRQVFKYKNIDKWWYPWFYFFYAYLVRAGVLDGRAGFYYAFYKLWYFLTIRLIIARQRGPGAS